jgi:hypothetical protein
MLGAVGIVNNGIALVDLGEVIDRVLLAESGATATRLLACCGEEAADNCVIRNGVLVWPSREIEIQVHQQLTEIEQ